MSKQIELVRQAVEEARGKAVYYRNQAQGEEYELLDNVAGALMELTLVIDNHDI